MEHKLLEKLFDSHNHARDYLAENPGMLIEGSELVQSEFRVVKGVIDVLLKKEDTFYLIEVKDYGSLYSARQQLSRYGRTFERFSPLFKDKKLKYIVVKVQKHLGTDVYFYDDLDDILSVKNDYQSIHYERVRRMIHRPEVIEKQNKNWEAGMKKYKDKVAREVAKKMADELSSQSPQSI